jgi:peroxiredoxin
MLPLGTYAPEFTLPDTDGRPTSLKDFEAARALVVMFICNHCPYVIHVADGIAKLADEYLRQGVAFVAINANDAQAYPEDRPALMKQEKKRRGYHFPYLYDESQEVAKAYEAACTPDFYVFDEKRRLIYRGQMDDSRPGNGVPVTGEDLKLALDQVLKNAAAVTIQKPSMGCNIKWKEGNAPLYTPG